MKAAPGMSVLLCPFLVSLFTPVLAQEYGRPDRESPGDEMIQDYLRRETDIIHGRFLEGVDSLAEWESRRVRYREEYLHMLGLWPLPGRTPLRVTRTGTVRGDGFVVEKLHYQSRPRLYVTANLYRPPAIREGERLPAVLYVCGHSGMGRNGNKTAFQSHGMWFARHGYVCLMLDSLQLGEIAATHHGTYRYQRWWWHSRGYTSAGVECWNGVRGIDYLASRPDVDPARIAVTGISGGGAATFWIAAADERVRVAVPVSGMADLPSYVTNRVINGHCDCMFLYNTFQWPWTRIAALVAPRPLLFVNSDRDRIFPMDANERVINRLERLYSLHGAGDRVDSVVSIGGHAYREDIRQAVYRFINTHLKGDPGEVTDSEVDLVTRSGRERHCPIPPEELRVFAEDGDIPPDQLNTTIDEHLVPVASVAPPGKGEFGRWKERLLAELRRVSFRSLPSPIPAARAREGSPDLDVLETEPGIAVRLRTPGGSPSPERPARILLVVPDAGEDRESGWLESVRTPGDDLRIIEPRGTGDSAWTRKNPPNYVERSLVLLGRTADTGRVRDVIAAARHLRERHGGEIPLHVAGRGSGSIIAAYAALLEPDAITGAILHGPPLTHADPAAPQFLNVLRVADIPEVLGMLAPRPLTVHGVAGDTLARTEAIYRAAGAAAHLHRR